MLPILLTLCLGVVCVPEDEARTDVFEKRIRPVLVDRCYECHSSAALVANKLEGELRLGTREGIRCGGERGRALVPGKSDESVFLHALRYGGDLRMPPSGKLSDSVIADFAHWIDMGVPDRRDTSNGSGDAAENWDQIFRARLDWWSLKPVVNPGVPAVQDDTWSKNVIDRFVLSRLESVGLRPAPAANPRTFA